MTGDRGGRTLQKIAEGRRTSEEARRRLNQILLGNKTAFKNYAGEYDQ